MIYPEIYPTVQETSVIAYPWPSYQKVYNAEFLCIFITSKSNNKLHPKDHGR